MVLAKDWLVVQINDTLFNATIEITIDPPVWIDGEMAIGAQKKYAYRLESGAQIVGGSTKKEAISLLLSVAKDKKWRVFQPLN